MSQCAVVLSSRDSSDRVMEPNVSEWRVDHSPDPELNAMVARADAYTQPVFLQQPLHVVVRGFPMVCIDGATCCSVDAAL